MINKYIQQVEKLASDFRKLQANSQDLQLTAAQVQLNLQSELAIKSASAVNLLTKLTQLIRGDFTPVSLLPQVETTIKDLDASWREIAEASERSLDSISLHSDNVSVAVL